MPSSTSKHSTFEEEFEAAPIKRVFLTVRGARAADRHYGYDPGRTIEGAYKVVRGEVIMVDAHGHEVTGERGQKYRHVLKLDKNGNTPSGELSAGEAASRMARQIKSGLKINGPDRVAGFDGPLHYRKLGWL
jgi:hypothetical protein